MKAIMKPIAILFHVSNVAAASLWYKEAFRESSFKTAPDGVPPTLMLGGVELEFVPADQKVRSGRAGTVVYWAVDSVTQEITRLESIGATLYRGPIAIENKEIMCQMLDPFDNLFGLRGSA